MGFPVCCRNAGGFASGTAGPSAGAAGAGGALRRTTLPSFLFFFDTGMRAGYHAGAPGRPVPSRALPVQALSASPRIIVSVTSSAITLTTCFLSMAMSESRTSSGPTTSRIAL